MSNTEDEGKRRAIEKCQGAALEWQVSELFVGINNIIWKNCDGRER